MPRNYPDRRMHPDESRTEWHHRMQATFIACNLKFGPEMEVRKDNVRDAYMEWVGKADEDFAVLIIRDLYESITRMGAEPDRDPQKGWEPVKKFKGVGWQELPND